MIRYIDSKKMGRGIHEWLDSYFHFSFAEYYHPKNIHFGVLRVVNDDQVKPKQGFDIHPHRDMEIISYVVNGALTHGDSMGNKRTLTRGQVQYMSAGTGVHHSEYNWGDETLRFLQIWILPDRKGYAPNYGDYPFKMEERENKWLPIATSVDNKESKAPIHIHADVNLFATLIEAGKSIDLEVKNGRQAYLVLIEGSMEIAETRFNMRDAAEITEENVTIQAKERSHILVIEMAK
jgi:redox-sensitive bicupin YhaK (pirin superfamily)